MVLKWFASGPAEAFARELAASLLVDLQGSLSKDDAKFMGRAEKALARAEGRVREFKERERLNVWTKSKLANAFLWSLKDAGCPDEYAKELTQWLTIRL